MATLKDIATGDTAELIERTEAQRKMERVNMIRKIKQGRKLVGIADNTEGAKFVAAGLADARFFVNKDGKIEVWASYGWITCEFDPYIAFQRVGLATDKYEFVNVMIQPELPKEVMDTIDSILDLVIDNKMSPDDLAKKVNDISGTGETLIFEVWGIL
jgi:hypothetical protein